MEQDLKSKIVNLLKSEGNLSIINSDEFYFQKAKDALLNFLDLKVSNELKVFLTTNKKDYNQLKSRFETSEDLLEFGRMLFTIVSYCDSKAYRKRELNQYKDKRVLALAFVRMNNWVEQLITYKFERIIVEGSIKNAIEYLLDPLENFTMLSENHRSQISENLFQKPYHKNSFKDNYFKFFSDIIPSVINVENVSHLLTRLSYDISSEWKESVIGLISPDGTGWQEDAIQDSKDGKHIALWNHKKPNGTTKTIKLLRQCIEENEFFRVFYTSNYNVKYVAEIIDIATDQKQLDKLKWPDTFGDIVWYHDDFNKYKDDKRSASWVYLARRIYEVDKIPSSNFEYLKPYGYPSVGCQAPVVSLKSNIEIQIEKQMKINLDLLKYKKQIILQGPPGTGKTRLAKEIAIELIKENEISNQTIRIKSLTKDFIKQNLKIGDAFKGKSEKTFTVEDITRSKVILKSEDSKSWTPSFNKIIISFTNKLWDEKGRSGGLIPYEDAVAKYFHDNFIDILEEKESMIDQKEDYSKLIQFHPSYTYEDFVRGIVSKPNEDGSGIIYEAENRILAEFADRAFHDQDNNYVLILDEINRANLSSVLGELIYALEYRGDAVESMYSVNESNKLILPCNLYIIGTMNTADRSVGHIDYALRRRFAFVEILPKNLKTELTDNFDENLFGQVAELFIENFDHAISYNKGIKHKKSKHLNFDFEPNDVWLGHSYFIRQYEKDENGDDLEAKPYDFKMRLDYEIKPILLEYVKDGILKESAKEQIELLKTTI